MFQIKWTKDALHDQIKILKYWIKHNRTNSYSMKIAKEVKKTEALLKKNPLMGEISEFKNVRYVLILKNFSIYYRINGQIIEVVSFWDNRRNPEDLEI